jgi:elongation factor G
VALVGHSAAGKTTLGEAMLLAAGLTTRLGSVDEGTSILDWDEESRERRHSVDSSFFHIPYKSLHLNLFDTPGIPDYCGVAIAALAAVETAAVVVSAASGLGVNTRRMAGIARDCGLARMVVISRIDAEGADLAAVLAGVRETLGPACHPINLPADRGRRVVDVLSAEQGSSDLLDVHRCHSELIDSIVETDEALMETYMSGETLSPEQLAPAIQKAVASGHLIPVLFVCARSGVGVPELLEALARFAPAPDVGKQRLLRSGEGDSARETPIVPSPEGDFIAQVVKVTTDPRSNIRYSLARVHSGTLREDGQIFLSGDRRGQRPGHLFKLRGSQHEQIPLAGAGDIVAFAKLDLRLGATIFARPSEGSIELPRFPTPMAALAIEPRARGDVEKISAALHRFAEEDPCFEYHRDSETGELVMRGLGEMHLTVVRSKMRRYFRLEVDTKPPKIPYRETISGSVKYVEYTHKKQTGGAGQYARVCIDLEPNERGRGYEFIDKIFGGAIDLQFRPAVDKGIQAQMKQGVIAGYPVVDVKVYLVDGKTHPVDSKDIAFQIAGRQAFKKAFVQCKPILLEPIVHIEVTAPTENVGEITRDLAGKRGQILGQDMLPGNQCCVRATVPLAEVSNYGSQLKSVTGGQGSYVMEFSHYDVVPPNIQQQIVAAHKPREEEE